MASLSKAVYNLGLQNTILDPTKSNFLALLDNKGNLLAYSKIFKGTDSLIGEFANGKLEIKTINYQDTASVENLTAGVQAEQFAIVSWPTDAANEGTITAYTDQTFIGPKNLGVASSVTIIDEDGGADGADLPTSTATALKAWLIGNLSATNMPMINAASNFLFSGATVTFSEQ